MASLLFLLGYYSPTSTPCHLTSCPPSTRFLALCSDPRSTETSRGFRLFRSLLTPQFNVCYRDKAAQSEFGLEVGLQGINGVSIDHNDTGGDGGAAIVVSVVVLTLLASVSGFVLWLRTKHSSRKKWIVAIVVSKHHHNYGSSVIPHPSQRSVTHWSGACNVHSSIIIT
jgi:hypothetical protein